MPAALAPTGARRRRTALTRTTLTLASLLLAGMTAGCASSGSAEAQAGTNARTDYSPTRGQQGKDVMWIPTPDQLVTRMLQLARLTANDRLVDLGSGDGKIVIAAARDFNAAARGIEYNANMVTLSRQRAAGAGVADRTRFEQGDIFKVDFSEASVVTMYLLPELNLRLRRQLFTMKPGTRIVSHYWTMGHWQPDEVSRVGGVPIHLWIIPANLGGQWALDYRDGRGPVSTTLEISQHFQRVTKAQVDVDGQRNTVREAMIDGSRFQFAFTDGTGVLRRFDGQVGANGLDGEVRGSDGSTGRFQARRLATPLPITGTTGYTDEEMALGATELGG